MVVRKLIAQNTLPAEQIVKFAPRKIERTHLDLPCVNRFVESTKAVVRYGQLKLSLSTSG